MKNILLTAIAAGALPVLFANPATAQNANGAAHVSANAASGITTKNVDPIRPFGSIDVYNVGLDPVQVAAWVKTLSTTQRQEMLSRCSVIVQNQQDYFEETTNFCQSLAFALAENAGGTGTAAQ
jgi:hypothetical protein